MTTNISEYETQAQAFLDKTNTELRIESKWRGRHFDSDTEDRDIYLLSLVRTVKNEEGADRWRHHPFQFGQSLNNSGDNPKVPTAYDVLTSVTKYDPGTFEEFCGEYGYDTDSRKAEKTHEAVKHEYSQMAYLYSEAELEEMAEIQLTPAQPRLGLKGKGD